MTRKRKSYQRGNVALHFGVWTLRYRELDHRTGKWLIKRERLGKFKNKKAALRAAEPIMARVNEHNNSDRPPEALHLTFRQFVDSRWKAYSVTAQHQPSTLDCYNSLLRCHLLPYFGEMLLKDIKPIHVSEFLEAFDAKSGKRVGMLYALLRVMFSLAADYDLIEQSPVRTKLHKPDVEKAEKPTLAAKEIRAILDHLDDQGRLRALLIAVTGLRINEALALRWIDFDEQSREIHVEHTLYKQRLKPPKSATSRRTLRLHPSVSYLLAAHKAESDFTAGEDFIFCRASGEPLRDTSMRRRLYQAMDAVGIERGDRTHGFHIFRHTAGSLMYARSRDLKLVQGALGHSGISITSDIYVHLDGDRVAEGTEMLAEDILGDFLANCDLTVTEESKMVS
ncbi:MAG: tyrosine recombinase XerC [Blastocatellia bacterium]